MSVSQMTFSRSMVWDWDEIPVGLINLKEWSRSYCGS